MAMAESLHCFSWPLADSWIRSSSSPACCPSPPTFSTSPASCGKALGCPRQGTQVRWQRRRKDPLAAPGVLDAVEKENYHKERRHVCRCSGQEESLLAIEGGRQRYVTDQRPFKSSKQWISAEESDYSYGLDVDDVLSEENLQDASLLKAVVKVYCISAEPDYSLPWQLQRQHASTGSGFMISGRRLLTNAHCVEYHTQVKVKRTGDDTRYIAKVLAIGEECDIALLTVDDEEFWRDAEPLQLGNLPYLQDSVTVVGYPVGGETISVTKGVVSRIEVTSYAHGDSELLTLQIDAAINPGNSGGPAFNKDGDCVGIAFQTYSHGAAENIGYVIPTTVISHFLRDYNLHGRYTGFPALGVWLQKLENPHLRAYLKMKNNQKGVLVRMVAPTSPCKDIIREGDVILSFDGVPVSNEGTVPFRPGERISITYLVSQKFTGDQAVLGILRDGNEIEVTTTLKPMVHLVPVHIKGRQPSYFIIAGLVFTPVSNSLLQEDYEADSMCIGIKVRAKSRHNMAEFEGEEIVLLSQVLANAVNIGYEDVNHVQVLCFNGTKIKNTRHLAELVDACDTQYMRFELDDNFMIVLVTKSARASTPKILKDYCIAQDRSQDLNDSTENKALNGAVV